jgi:hypothetical protein
MWKRFIYPSLSLELHVVGIEELVCCRRVGGDESCVFLEDSTSRGWL